MKGLAALTLVLLLEVVLMLRDSERLDFMLIGDFGDIDQLDKAEETFKTINAYAGDHDFKFFVTLGDNVYYEGISSVDDPKFRKMYKLFENDNIKHLPIYPTLGNHDCYGKPQAEVDISSKSDNNWEMKGLHYSMTFDTDGDHSNGDELGILVLNGCELCCLSEAPES